MCLIPIILYTLSVSLSELYSSVIQMFNLFSFTNCRILIDADIDYDYTGLINYFNLLSVQKSSLSSIGSYICKHLASR